MSSNPDVSYKLKKPASPKLEESSQKAPQSESALAETSMGGRSMVESETTLVRMDVATANGVFNDGKMGHRDVQFVPAATAAAARAGGD